MSENINQLVSIRQIEVNDLNFLLDSYISCLSKYRESIAKGIDQNYLHKHLENLMLYILNNEDYSTFICCDKDDSQHIIAYIISNTNNNHIFFNYTKYSYRKLGVQKHLLLPLVIDNEIPVTVQWQTKEMLKLVREGKISIQNRVLDKLLKERSDR